MQQHPANPSLVPTIAAFVAATASVAGSLYLTLGLGLIACPLCFYQRTFAFAVLGSLIVGLMSKASETGYVNLFTFLPAVAGGMIAGWHTYLDVSGKLVCPLGLFDFGTTAQQSLASFVLILACLLVGLAGDVKKGRVAQASVGWSILLGAAFAYGCIATSPKPSMPAKEIRPFICHPPEPS